MSIGLAGDTRSADVLALVRRRLDVVAPLVVGVRREVEAASAGRVFTGDKGRIGERRIEEKDEGRNIAVRGLKLAWQLASAVRRSNCAELGGFGHAKRGEEGALCSEDAEVETCLSICIQAYLWGA